MTIINSDMPVLEELKITADVEFVPWSKSRYAGEKNPSLNWKVKLLVGDRIVLETDYMAGCGHCPSYSQRQTIHVRDAIKQECETGRKTQVHALWSKGPAILPKLADIVNCLVSDGDAIDYPTFEDWASSFGYDTDSRKAEATYRTCLETGLKLRAALGDENLRRLREAFQDY